MKKFELTASKDGVAIDYAKTIYAKEEPGFWTLENLAADHGCDFWTIEEISTIKTNRVKVGSRIDLAAIGYRLGKIKAERISGASAEILAVDDYMESIEWQSINAETGLYYLIYTDFNGNVTGSETETLTNHGAYDECVCGERYDAYYGFEFDNCD